MLQKNNVFIPHHAQNVVSREWERIHIPRDSRAQGLPKWSRQSCRTGTAICITLLQTHTQGHILPPSAPPLAAGTSTSKVPEELPKTMPQWSSSSSWLQAASSTGELEFCIVHYPDVIHTLHSKAQGQKVDVLQPHPSQIPGSSGTFSIRRRLKAPPEHSTLLFSSLSALILVAPLITPDHTRPIPKSGSPRGCDLQSLHFTAPQVPARMQRGWRQKNTFMQSPLPALA